MDARSIIVTIAVAVPAFAITLLARPAGAPMPPDSILPLFAVYFLAESLAFGAGVAYVIKSRRTLFGPRMPALTRAVAWCVAYLLLAPWPHDYLHSLVHISGVFDWPALVGIEYAFHFGVVPIGVVVAAYLARSKLTHRAARESAA